VFYGDPRQAVDWDIGDEVKKLRHQRQPSRTSCGPTCVAMLADVPVARVLALVPTVRLTPSRQRRKDDRTNVGEMRRLLAAHGLEMGGRNPGIARSLRPALLRIPHWRGANWHYAVSCTGWLFDPAKKRVVELRPSLLPDDVAHYEIRSAAAQ